MPTDITQYIDKAKSGNLTDPEKDFVIEAAETLMRYSRIGRKLEEPLNGDYEGGCPSCGFGNPSIMSLMTACPMCER